MFFQHVIKFLVGRRSVNTTLPNGTIDAQWPSHWHVGSVGVFVWALAPFFVFWFVFGCLLRCFLWRNASLAGGFAGRRVLSICLFQGLFCPCTEFCLLTTGKDRAISATSATLEEKKNPTGMWESSRNPSPFCSMIVPSIGTSIVALRLTCARLHLHVSGASKPRVASNASAGNSGWSFIGSTSSLMTNLRPCSGWGCPWSG